jgi:hypothetical protein
MWQGLLCCCQVHVRSNVCPAPHQVTVEFDLCVAEVTATALVVLVAVLTRALNDRSMEVQRRAVVVIDNLVKLVRDPCCHVSWSHCSWRG